MDFMPAVDIECTNSPIRVSFCDASWTENAELGSENHSPAFNGDKGSQQHPASPIQGQPFERKRHSTINSTEADESCWLQKNEECEFDLLDGISDISVNSDDYPVPESKITLQAIAQRWLDKMADDDKDKESDDKAAYGVKESHEPKTNNISNNEESDDKTTNGIENLCEEKRDEPNIVDRLAEHGKSDNELNENGVILHSTSTTSIDNFLQPQSANSFTKTEDNGREPNPNQEFRANSSSCNKDNSTNLNTTIDLPKPTNPQLPTPSTKNTTSEPMVCGEVAVIRECCTTAATKLELSSTVPTESTKCGVAEKSGKPVVHPSGAIAKKKGVVPPNVKPMFPARKLPVKNSAAMAKTPTKTNRISKNSSQSHLPNQEAKLSNIMKQKEPLNIKKSLLSRPIVVSKGNAKTESTVCAGPCKPAGLKRPVNKVITKSHPLQMSTIPAQHSTPIKEQAVSRRKSVAVSPQRDSSEATNDKYPTKQRRRSGIPLLGGMTRDAKVPMSPCNKVNDHESKSGLGFSPMAAGKKAFRPTKGARQMGIPKPKTQLNFNTSFDVLEGIDLDGPPPGGSKLVHSPAEKENNTVHSQWSPIKRNGGITADEECIRCTKHTAKYF